MTNWQKESEKFLVGKTIKSVRYMTEKEAKEIGWYKRPLLIIFDDGEYVFASRDDEGNDGGSLYTSDCDLYCIPVLGD
jgi:hypothetical protein